MGGYDYGDDCCCGGSCSLLLRELVLVEKFRFPPNQNKQNCRKLNVHCNRPKIYGDHIRDILSIVAITAQPEMLLSCSILSFNPKCNFCWKYANFVGLLLRVFFALHVFLRSSVEKSEHIIIKGFSTVQLQQFPVPIIMSVQSWRCATMCILEATTLYNVGIAPIFSHSGFLRRANGLSDLTIRP